MTMNNQSKQMYEQCKKHIHAYVLLETVDGMNIDGIITGLDDEYVYVAAPNDVYSQTTAQTNDRQFFYPGYGFDYGFGWPGYGFPGYGYGRPGRFRRLVLPLAALAAISLLPWY